MYVVKMIFMYICFFSNKATYTALKTHFISSSRNQTHDILPHITSWADDLPYEGPKTGRTQSHVSFDSKEAQENGGNAFNNPQIIKLLGVFREDLL